MNRETAWAVAVFLAAIALCVTLISVPYFAHVLIAIYGAGVYTALALAFIAAPLARRFRCLSK